MKKRVTSLKGKSALFLIVIVLIVFMISWGLFRIFYLNFHEKNMEKAVIILLEYMEDHFENVEDACEWTNRNLNIQVYEFAGLEELIAKLPTGVGIEDVLSLSERKEIEKGECIVKNIKVTDFQIKMQTFFYPIMRNGNIDHLLVTYMPVNNPRYNFIGFPFFVVLAMSVVACITFIIARKSFGQSYNQLQEIKQVVKEVSNGNYDQKIWKNSTDELGEITDVINQMSSSLKINQQQRKEFMEDISHEIKTPLTYIKTYNQALLDGMIQNPQEVHKSYHLIERETIRLQKLIQNFLDFTKLEANTVELSKQPIVFAQAIEEIMMKYEPIFRKEHVQFEMMLDYDIIIEGDEERLEQIIQNIIHNAIRYSKAHPRIEMKLVKHQNSCILSIADNGIGIGEEHLAVITNRFVRVNKVRSRKESGTGIGLSIVEKLMTLHGGHMKIESELGIGTTFSLSFPCVD